MWLLVGLGNPGDKYEHNRHNIGFMALDAIAAAHGFPAFKKKFQGLLSEGGIAGEKIILLKPQTYMNNSGQSVGEAAKFYKIPLEHIVAFHDELDLPTGKIRTKKGGGNAGHNGLRSMDNHLNSNDYWRVRLGIGHPGDRALVHGHVLGDFSKSDSIWLKPLIESVGIHAPLLVQGKDNEFMSKVAQSVDVKE
ncbi:MAG: aminoacyl-tRNA hydrolase [Micavibrio aeruginosavorus]|uniref:Peptidyl-tRNA hydrolase n=1 Tax=Micavibrio aeruginosavorus TaxID=349221 RepID=A0A7T5UIX9_9BACT|nr:MAG: aminoacyl-tRNA hydrolase [Micavibrio aeruginosavorus]